MNQQEPSDWRLVITEQDRLTITEHIFGKLKEFALDVPDDWLQKRARHFENQAFCSAANTSEYLNKIALGLSKIEVASDRRRSSTLYQPQQIQQPQQEQQLHHQLEDLYTNDVSIQDRLSFIQCLFIKLKNFAPDLPPAKLHQRTRHFEDQIFYSAVNRSQYLTNIAHALSNIEIILNTSNTSSTVNPQQQNQQNQQKLKTNVSCKDVSVKDRLSCTTHIAEKLKNFAPDCSKHKIYQDARRFEDHAFLFSITQIEYLTKIAHALTKIEIASNRSSTSNPQQQDQQPQH